MTSVLIVEDQRMPRENMEHLVEDSGRYRRVASLSTAEMALAQCARHAVDLVLMDVCTKQVFYDKLTFIYLEMPKFNKSEDELVTMFDKWLFVLRNLSRLMARPAALQDRIFTRLFEAAEIAKFTKEQYEAYEESLKVYRDWQNTIVTAEQKGMAKGLEKGLAEGRAQGVAEGLAKGIAEGRMEQNIANARSMKLAGLDYEIISQVTGLSKDEIDKL